jgi:hypothetical protein
MRIVTQGNPLVRRLVAAVLATVLVPISWSLAQLGTPGFLLAHKVFEAEPPSLGHLNTDIEVAAAVDFAIWFAALWGAQDLWLRLREELEERDSAVRSNRPRDPAILVGSTLVALPSSIYLCWDSPSSQAAGCLTQLSRSWARLVCAFLHLAL